MGDDLMGGDAQGSAPSDPDFAHRAVLLEETAGLLAGCHRILDGTAGAGGHARRLAERARVLAIDHDPAAVAATRAALGPTHEVRCLNFADAAADPEVRAFEPDGILLDLGVSSPQFDDAARGFTFRPGAPLDMRMTGAGPTAADWLNEAPVGELTRVFAELADEPRARPLARQVVRRRGREPFRISDDLVNAVRAVLGPRSGPGDFARIFQAVRIVVNGELEQLARALPELFALLPARGVVAVISYHSGEDRIVKHLFRDWARACVCPAEQPVCTCRGRPLGILLTRKSIAASTAEVAANPRARSARLRACRKASV